MRLNDAIYQCLAAKYDILFYPFFLDGVALRPDMNLPDGMHPNDWHSLYSHQNVAIGKGIATCAAAR